MGQSADSGDINQDVGIDQDHARSPFPRCLKNNLRLRMQPIAFPQIARNGHLAFLRKFHK